MGDQNSEALTNAEQLIDRAKEITIPSDSNEIDNVSEAEACVSDVHAGVVENKELNVEELPESDKTNVTVSDSGKGEMSIESALEKMHSGSTEGEVNLAGDSVSNEIVSEMDIKESIADESILSDDKINIKESEKIRIDEDIPMETTDSTENVDVLVDQNVPADNSVVDNTKADAVSPKSIESHVDSIDKTIASDNTVEDDDKTEKVLSHEHNETSVASTLENIENVNCNDDCSVTEHDKDDNIIEKSNSEMDSAQPLTLASETSEDLPSEKLTQEPELNDTLMDYSIEGGDQPQAFTEMSVDETLNDDTMDKLNETTEDPFKSTEMNDENQSCAEEDVSDGAKLQNDEIASEKEVEKDVSGTADSVSTSLDSDKGKCTDLDDPIDTLSSSSKGAMDTCDKDAEKCNSDIDSLNTDRMENENLEEKDPIGSEPCEAIANEEGADEELCIIPDTEREISQAEKDAASAIPPLRDPTEDDTSIHDSSSRNSPTEKSSDDLITISKYEKDELQICVQCKLKRKMNYYYEEKDYIIYLCDDKCLKHFKDSKPDQVRLTWEEGNLRVKNFSETPSIRKCEPCGKIIRHDDANLTWEFLDFCNEVCLFDYQKKIGSQCATCQMQVKSNSLGKYCVRFGYAIKQFCTNACLEKYKKGVKVCAYCQKDMSNGPAGFLAPIGDRGNFKDFCSQNCIEKYDISTNKRPPKVPAGTICTVCKQPKKISIEFELDGTPNYFCSEPCLKAFSFVRNIGTGVCATCQRYHLKEVLEKNSVYFENIRHCFCSANCENLYIIAHRKIVPCCWCKVKKYNFDMIRKNTKTCGLINLCSVNCLRLYTVSFETATTGKTNCNFCQKHGGSMYILTMSDATLRNFCSFNCVVKFQGEFQNQPISGYPVPVGAPRRNKRFVGNDPGEVTNLPIISSIQSLASTNGNIGTPTTQNTRSTRSKATGNQTTILSPAQTIGTLDIPTQIKKYFIIKPPPTKEQRNMGTMCYTKKSNKALMAQPVMVDKEVQTDEREASKVLIPVPVPIYVPTPMHMYSVPTPVPIPIPFPIPIPIFIPTTRNSAAGIMKEIKKIQVKIPTDPYEAELLMMAEMVAEEKKEDLTDSESDVDDNGGPEDSYSPEPVDPSNTFGDDMLQMALKMATELDEPAVDLEGALTANTITAPQGSEGHGQEENVDDPQPMHHMLDRNPAIRGRKRGMRQSRGGSVAKRGRRMSHHQVDMPMMQHVQQPPPPPEPAEKPDANMCLKYTFGVNAWKQWVTTKNAELEKSSRRVKLFNTEILQLTSDELNYSLCLFVKEVRKPNGAEYAPDTIYYLCLGIQQYLFENGRIDNIFCDPYYEKFTDCLDEVAKKFSVLYNDSHYIVTRVEEEHLWESKQLGAHSPHVLLSTLMFFNTKHFNLTSVDEHMQLSFSHIMKHWKRNPNQPGASKLPGSRNVLLRFYPPQSAIQNNARKKKVYEQQENEENPLRCPVKLYEFYLSKCPESVKTRNDVFYLLPERSCVPDSPVWYSTMPLPKEALEKMLHRVKMVKEINVALLTS